MNDRRPSVGFLFVWHALVMASLFAVADLRVAGMGFWSFRREEFLASLFLLGAYLVTALVSIVAAAVGRPLRLSTVAVTSLSTFGVAFFLLLFGPSTPPYSRALLLLMVAAALTLATASVLASRTRYRSVGGLRRAILALDLYKTFGPRKVPPMTRSTKDLATALYPVGVFVGAFNWCIELVALAP
jgi:hypothetical protein